LESPEQHLHHIWLPPSELHEEKNNHRLASDLGRRSERPSRENAETQREAPEN
jgi:hypothetical protein